MNEIKLAAAAAVLLLSSAAANAADNLTIGFANPLPAYPVWAQADKCFNEEVAKVGVKGLTSGPTGLQIDNQFVLDRISQYIATGANGIILVPIDGPMYEPLMKDAKAKKIWVVTLNTGDTTTTQDVQLGTDYHNQGKVVAENIAKRQGDQNVIILGNQPTGVHRVFVDGFKAALAEHPNVKLIAEGYDQADPAQTTDVVSRLLTGHPEVNVVLSWEGTAVAGITTAIKEKGLVGKVVGVVNDLTPEVIAGLKDGTLYGTSKQNFCGMAKGAVDTIVALAAGKTVSKNIDTGITFVTLENLDAEQNQ
jgi:ribose transport system substrate-binding protein